MGNDIAVIAYGERVPQAAPPYQHSVPWLRGVRYTEEGPVLGPAIGFPVAGKVHVMQALKGGSEGEAWILTTVRDNTNIGDYLRLGRVTMDPVTLVVSVSWRPDYMTKTGQYAMELWADQRRAIVATSGGDATGGKHEKSLYLMDLDTGQLVAHAPLPLSTSTSRLWVRAMSFQLERLEVLVIGDRVTSGFDRPTFWTIPVAASSIGTAVRHDLPGLPLDYDGDIYSEGWNAQPLSGSRWMVAGIYSTNDEYWIGDGWGSARLRHYTFSGISTVVEQDPLSESAYADYRFGGSGSFDPALNGVLLAAGAWEETGRVIGGTPSTGLGGLRHLEASDSGAILDSMILPRTADTIDRDGTVSVVALGGDRYLYLVGAAGITGAVTGRQTSFEFVVYAGGPVMKEPFVPGMKGTAPEENRRTFRRVIY